MWLDRARRLRHDISAALEIAVREFPLAAGEADYLLYAAGIVEAKPEGQPFLSKFLGIGVKYRGRNGVK